MGPEIPSLISQANPLFLITNRSLSPFHTGHKKFLKNIYTLNPCGLGIVENHILDVVSTDKRIIFSAKLYYFVGLYDLSHPQKQSLIKKLSVVERVV